MKWVHRIFLALTLAPLVLWVFGFALLLAIGFGLGCQISDAQVHPCLFFGRDIGPLAQHVGVLVAWAPLIVGPAMLVAGLAWGATTLVTRLWRRLR